jgi:hypothetical protein
MEGVLDAVARDAKCLRRVLKYRSIQRKFLTNTAASYEFQAIMAVEPIVLHFVYLRWNKFHLRAVKIEFENRYGTTIESQIDGLSSGANVCDAFICFLKALVDLNID